MHPIKQLIHSLKQSFIGGILGWCPGGVQAFWWHPTILAASWLRPGSFQASWLCAGVLATFRHPGGCPDSVLHPVGIQVGSWRLQMACGVMEGSRLTRRVFATSVCLAGGGTHWFFLEIFVRKFKRGNQRVLVQNWVKNVGINKCSLSKNLKNGPKLQL